MLIYSQVAKYTKHLDKMWQTLYCKWWTLHAKDTRLHNIYKPYQYWCQWTKGVFNVPSLFRSCCTNVFEYVASDKTCPSVHICMVLLCTFAWSNISIEIKSEQGRVPVQFCTAYWELLVFWMRFTFLYFFSGIILSWNWPKSDRHKQDWPHFALSITFCLT